jgi:YesN/AraC family two-component response regulator
LKKKQEAIAELNVEVGVYKENFLYKEDKLNEIYNEVLKLIEEEKVHLNHSDLSLKFMSKKLASNDAYISYAINHFAGVNFNKFINKYRIEEAKRLLELPENSNTSLELIVKNCGFSSSNTFYRVFKEATSMSPAKYRKKFR